MSLALAGAMTSLCLYTMIPVAPFGGWLFARSVGVIPGILLSLASMAALPVLLLTNIPPAALMIVFGASVGFSSGPIFALAGQGFPPEERALATGSLFTIFYAAMAAAPPLAGFARDITVAPQRHFTLPRRFLCIACGGGRCQSLRVSPTSFYHTVDLWYEGLKWPAINSRPSSQPR
jgi:MFS family permease